MFFRKYKKIKQLETRVAELEEILCPFNRHDWINVGYHLESFDNGYTTDEVYHYKCRRCKKYIETTRVM